MVADMTRLEAFHRRCQRQILDIRWWAHVSNAQMLQRSGLSAIGELRHRRLSLFGHVARHRPGVPAQCSTSDGGKLRRQKANGQPAGEDHQAAFNSVWFNNVQQDANVIAVYAVDRRSSGVMERHNTSLGLRDDDDDCNLKMHSLSKLLCFSLSGLLFKFYTSF